VGKPEIGCMEDEKDDIKMELRRGHAHGGGDQIEIYKTQIL